MPTGPSPPGTRVRVRLTYRSSARAARKRRQRIPPPAPSRRALTSPFRATSTAPSFAECAASVLSQPIPNLRLLIVDNASTDGSQEVAREIAAADSRVTLFLNEHNRGLHDSCNRAIDWAEADYFLLLDADDLLAADSLARGMAFLDSHPEVAFLYGVEGRLVDGLLDPGRCDARTTRWNVTTGTEFIRRTCWDSFCDVGAPTVLVRTVAQKSAGHYRENLVRTFDFEMYLRLAMEGDVAHTNRVHGVRRMHPTQLTTPFIENPIRDFEEHESPSRRSSRTRAPPYLKQENSRRCRDEKWVTTSTGSRSRKRIRGRSHAQSAFEFSASRRRKPKWLPPLTFLFKKRWARSAWRGSAGGCTNPCRFHRRSRFQGTSSNDSTRVAIVHERFTEVAGSEHVVEQLAAQWPDAGRPCAIGPRRRRPARTV